ncbi:MAG TPA: hypothetical protein VEB23_06930, partial [Ramlibacter sp.]|nr:hypothetical protein [Ramlibacter sp.]
ANRSWGELPVRPRSRSTPGVVPGAPRRQSGVAPGIGKAGPSVGVAAIASAPADVASGPKIAREVLQRIEAASPRKEEEPMRAVSPGPGPLSELRERLSSPETAIKASDQLIARENEAGVQQLHWVPADEDVTRAESWRARRLVKDLLTAGIEAFPGTDVDTSHMLFPEQSSRQFTDPMSRSLRAGELLGMVHRIESQLRHFEAGSPSVTPIADQGVEPLLGMLAPLPRGSYLAAAVGADGQVHLQSRLTEPSDAETQRARREVAALLRTTQERMEPVHRDADLHERLAALQHEIEHGAGPLTAHEVKQGVVESARAALDSTLLGRMEPAPEPPPHTTTEAVTVLLDEMDRARAGASPQQLEVLMQLDRQAKYQWLAQGLTIGGTTDLLLQAQARLEGVGLNRLASVARTLTDELNDERGRAQLLIRQHDNAYGRVLESSFADALNEQPAPAMLRAAADAGIALADLLERLPPREKGAVCTDAIRRLTEQYPRHWTTSEDAISRLVHHPSPGLRELCGALREEVTRGDDALRVQQLVAMTSSALGHYSQSVPWALAAKLNRDENIAPARGIEKYYDNPPDLTYGGGIMLRHHAPVIESRQWSRRGAVQQVYDLSRPARTHLQAFQAGRPIGAGVSTTAGMGLEFFEHLSRDPGEAVRAELQHTGRREFDAQAALLDHMKWLVFDGGHSLHDALWTANQRGGNAELHGQQREDPESYVSNYASYFENLRPDLRLSVDRALDHAWAKLLAHRREQVERP